MFKKKKKENKEPQFIELYFASKKEIKVLDLKNFLPDTEETNYWKIMDVLEIEYPNQTSLTFTPLDSDFSKEDEERLNSLGTKTILEVSFNEEIENEVRPTLASLVKEFDAVILEDDKDLSKYM